MASQDCVRKLLARNRNLVSGLRPAKPPTRPRLTNGKPELCTVCTVGTTHEHTDKRGPLSSTNKQQPTSTRYDMQCVSKPMYAKLAALKTGGPTTTVPPLTEDRNQTRDRPGT